MYIGGADTVQYFSHIIDHALIYFAQTWSTLYIFMLAMVLYPRVQAKAQAELDAVAGIKRLPSFDDRRSLKYLEWVVQETYRWHNAVPSGI